MALADILEALTAGGSAGLSAYARERELERERAERKRVRQEEARYRQQLLDFRKREEERAEAAAEYQRQQDTERGLIEGRLREVRDIYNPAAVRQSVAGLEQEIGGFGKAPGQTYAARMMRQQEERPKSALASALREDEPEVALEGMGRVSEQLPSRLSFLSEVPEFKATESFRERGSRQYGDTAVRPITPEEKAASERERFEEAVATNQGLLERAASGDEGAISEAYARGLGDQVKSMTELLRPEEPEAQGPTSFMQDVGYLMDQGLSFEDAVRVRTGRDPGGAGAVGLQTAIQQEAPDLDPQDVRAIFSDYTQWLAKGREPGVGELDARTEYNEFEKAAYLRQLINAFRSIKSGEVQDPYGGPFIQLGVPATRAPMLPGYTQPGLASPMDEFQRMYEEDQAARRAGGF